MFSVKILADSIHNNNRLTTFELEYPRYIHQEVLTHREFSRNAQSSRAIPQKRLVENLLTKSKVNPIFMKNKAGMSAIDTLSYEDEHIAKALWNAALDNAIKASNALADIGVHKQIANRLLEPFSTIKVILSSTSFTNFFNLRIHPDAQQEIQVLAKAMRDVLERSIPEKLDLMEWHLPLIDKEEKDLFNIKSLKRLSVARCARVSYLNHDGFKSYEDDYRLYDDLILKRHASPTEHIATPSVGRHGNFNGWMQHRQELSL
jgi:thymidylate synthase ThyX